MMHGGTASSQLFKHSFAAAPPPHRNLDICLGHDAWRNCLITTLQTFIRCSTTTTSHV